MIPRLRNQPPGTRTARSDPCERRLESLASEFALLAQRRARTIHQIDLLDQQRQAAAANLGRVQSRLAWLAQRMDALDPDLREPREAAPPWSLRPVPPPPEPQPTGPPHSRRVASAAWAPSFMPPPEPASVKPHAKASRVSPPGQPGGQWPASRPGARPRPAGKWRS